MYQLFGHIFLPPVNEVWGKVMFLHVSVHRGSASRVGGLLTGGVYLRDLPIWEGETPAPRTKKAGGMHPTGMLPCNSRGQKIDLIFVVKSRFCHLLKSISIISYFQTHDRALLLKGVGQDFPRYPGSTDAEIASVIFVFSLLKDVKLPPNYNIF